MLIIGAIIAGAGVYGYGRLTPSGGGASNQANIFVNTVAGATPSRCSSVCDYDATHAYGSFQAAYSAAQTGDSIMVTCNGASVAYYPTQDLATNNSGLTDYVTFEPFPGCDPYVGGYTELTAEYDPNDTTIDVTSTASFNIPGSIIIGNTNSGPSCTGKTATQFTGCTGAPNGSVLGNSNGCPAQGRGFCTFWIAGANVEQTNQAIGVSADWVRFDGINASSINVGNGSSDPDHVEILNADVHDASVQVGDTANDILYQNVTIGPNRGGHGTTFFQTGGGGTVPADIVFDDVTWTEVNANSCSSMDNSLCHMEATFWRYANGVTIKNSRFFKSEQYDMFITFSATNGSAGSFYARNVTIQNTFFGPLSCKISLADAAQGVSFPCNIAGNTHINFRADDSGLNRTLKDWTFENNTVTAGGSNVSTPLTIGTGMVMRGNYVDGTLFNCKAGFVYTYNVQTSTVCSGTGNVGGATFDVVDELTNDLHLASATTDANGAVAANCPTVDIDGDSRTNPCDAGADQFGSSVSGASQAVCTPSPCVPGTPVAATGATVKSVGSVAKGNGTSATRSYGLYVPGNLNPSATNKPAVVIMAAGAGSGSTEMTGMQTESHMNPVADANAFMVAYLQKNLADGTQWHLPNATFSCTYPTPCTAITDENYFTAVINNLVNTQNADPDRIYFVGGSAGGAAAADISCDPVNSLLLRGVAIHSNSPRVLVSGSLPSGDPNCSNWTSKTDDLFIMDIEGDNDSLSQFGKGSGTPVPPYGGPCGTTCGLSVYLNGDTAGNWYARHTGCSTTPTASTFGTPTAANLRNDYAGCSSHPGIGVSTFSIHNGNHQWCMNTSNSGVGLCPVANTNGFEMAQTMWDFFAATAS